MKAALSLALTLSPLLWAGAGCRGQGPADMAPVQPQLPAAPTPVSPQPAIEPPAVCTPATRQRMRRLSDFELGTVLRQLMGPTADVSTGLSRDPQAHGFDNAAELLSVSSSSFEELALLAERLAGDFPVATQAPCDQTKESPQVCAGRFVRSFARRAYGRPLSTDEEADLIAVYTAAATDGYEPGIRLIVEAVLSSPHFLYRSEIGALSGAVAQLSPFEVASQLSFFLGTGRPDPELLAAAENGALQSPDAYEKQGRRLFGTTAGQQSLRRLIGQWMGTDDVDAITKGFLSYPQFDRSLRNAMGIEARTFLDRALSPTGGNGRLDWMFSSSRSFVNKPVALIYGSDILDSPPTGDTFVEVKLAPARRQGFLSLPLFLAAHGGLTEPSPILRGIFIRERLLCAASVGSPPAEAGVLVQGKGQNPRDIFQAHSANPTCAACHRLIDPIGLGLQRMDGIGHYDPEQRKLETGSIISFVGTGDLVGSDVDGPFEGPAELSQRLLASDQFRDCVVTQLWRSFEGRDRQDGDSCELSQALKQLAGKSGSVAEAALGLLRRGNVAFRISETIPAPGAP